MISQDSYQLRRNTLLSKLEAQDIAFLPSGKGIKRNGDAEYNFRQQSDFHYLTGFNEPDAIAMFAPNGEQGEFVLFCQPSNPDIEKWTGPIAGQHGAVQDYQADAAFATDEFAEKLQSLLVGRRRVFWPIGYDLQFDKLIFKAVNELRGKIRSGIMAPQEFCNLEPIVHNMRLVKNSEELALMQKAVDITVEGHKRAMRACKPGLYEYSLEAELMHEFIRNGAREAAYTSIVGSGNNSCVLHYIDNNKQLQDGELVLIDAGAEYQLYAADLTRTFPVNGQYTGAQKDIYQLVLEAQLAGIEVVKPGFTYNDYNEAVIKVITQGLVDLNILQGNVDNLIEDKKYNDYYFHRAGHWIGMDVHDAGTYKVDDNWRALEPGMVLTVEPGLYFAKGCPADEKWWEIGVRIEDDVAVTEAGNQVLSAELPKTVAEVEALMAESA